MIPAGFRVRGDGLAVVLRNQFVLPGFAADGVVSTGMLPAPFLVVSVWVASTLSPAGSCQVTVVDAPITVAAVADQLLPMVGAQLFPFGPSLPFLAGPGEPPAIGPVQGSTDALEFWPWYLHERPGALALWVRQFSVQGGWQALVSLWPLERVDEAPLARVPLAAERVPDGGTVGPPRVPYQWPNAAVFNGRRP